MKKKAYVRMITNYGPLNIELHSDMVSIFLYSDMVKDGILFINKSDNVLVINKGKLHIFICNALTL